MTVKFLIGILVCLSFLFPPLHELTKGHENADKGNSMEPFVYRGCAESLVRICEKVLEYSYASSAHI